MTVPQRFEVAVGAILTQNTAWTNVEKALCALRRARALSPRRLATALSARLQRWIRSSGYFRQKARRLKNFSRHLLRRWDGDLGRLLGQSAAAARAELLSLNGVGPETADSILLYAGRHAAFVADAYTRRFGVRFGLFRGSGYDRVQAFFRDRLPPDAALFREYHALIVELAKRHCRATPLCGGCPLRPRCAAGRRR